MLLSRMKKRRKVNERVGGRGLLREGERREGEPRGKWEKGVVTKGKTKEMKS